MLWTIHTIHVHVIEDILCERLWSQWNNVTGQTHKELRTHLAALTMLLCMDTRYESHDLKARCFDAKYIAAMPRSENAVNDAETRCQSRI